MKTSKNIWRIISYVFLALLLIADALAVISLLRSQILPFKYIAIILTAIALITVLAIIFMFPHTGKYQKGKSSGRQITGYVLSAITIAGCLFGTHVIFKLGQTFNAITEDPTVKAIVGVYVLAEDPAKTIEDAADYKFATTDSYDAENAKATVSAIEDQLNGTITLEKYDSVFAMIDALYSGKAQALILNEAYIDILSDAERYADFTTKAKLLYEHTISATDPVPTESTEESREVSEPTETTTPAEASTTPFIMYLSGSDTRSKVLNKSRSDVNILAAVNPETKQILLVNTPRDYYIPNPAGHGALDKLTHCGIYGVDCSVKALSDLYHLPVSYYAQINFTGFETLINAIGGVTVYSDVSFTTLHGNYRIQKGENHLNGSQALGFARERYALSGGDNSRGQNQMKVITAVVEGMTSGTMLANYSSILDSLQGMFVTDMPLDTLNDLIKMQLSDMAHWNVLSYAVTGTGGSEIPYSMPGLHAYVMHPHKQTVTKATELMQKVLDGETLTQADLA